MSHITLDQLFDCTAEGGSFVAENADGSLIQIQEARSGLKCQCVCPGCGRQMVAKKGPVQTHHFAHHSRRDDAACTSAGETALHKFAKAILNKRLRISLPALEVSHRSATETVVRRRTIAFDEATLEKAAGSIVPDVVLRLGDRRLFVEFRVTHASDDRKIERIKGMDVGAIEIDLSHLRHIPLAEVAPQVLFDAPRIWLHNPLERVAHQKLIARFKEIDDLRARKIDSLQAAYHHPALADRPGKGCQETKARYDGLGDFLNVDIPGSGCFSAAPAEWQATVLLEMLGFDGIFRTRDGLTSLERRKCVHPAFRKSTVADAAVLRSRNIPFASPAEAVKSYFDLLRRRGFVHAPFSDVWQPGKALIDLMEYAKELRERPARRTNELRGIVENLLTKLVGDSEQSFDFQEWLESSPAGFSSRVSEAALRDCDEDWERRCRQISGLARTIECSPRNDMNLFGLPLENAIESALSKKFEMERLREKAERDRLESARLKRLADLKKAADNALGPHAQDWLTTANIHCDRLPPVVSASNSDGVASAYSALELEVSRMRREAEEASKLQNLRYRLRTFASERYMDEIALNLWLNSSRRELGGRSPINYTIDDTTLARCVTLLPSKRARR